LLLLVLVAEVGKSLSRRRPEVLAEEEYTVRVFSGVEVPTPTDPVVVSLVTLVVARVETPVAVNCVTLVVARVDAPEIFRALLQAGKPETTLNI
jgi:hypothetical protein